MFPPYASSSKPTRQSEPAWTLNHSTAARSPVGRRLSRSCNAAWCSQGAPYRHHSEPYTHVAPARAPQRPVQRTSPCAAPGGSPFPAVPSRRTNPVTSSLGPRRSRIPAVLGQGQPAYKRSTSSATLACAPFVVLSRIPTAREHQQYNTDCCKRSQLILVLRGGKLLRVPRDLGHFGSRQKEIEDLSGWKRVSLTARTK